MIHPQLKKGFARCRHQSAMRWAGLKVVFGAGQRLLEDPAE
jgi:hypothetical protein